MDKPFLPKSLLILTIGILTLPILAVFYFSETKVAAQTGDAPGSLIALNGMGQPSSACPLKHTDVKAEISGFISRVVVTQQFENNLPDKIEAVYTFPLPQNAAVDDMTMIIGTRTVKGKVLPREEAQAAYDAAKSSGRVASLLDQERPNIFTQSVANILPGEQVKITISYVETLKYEDGAYEFVFPMVVGPRYIPGSATSRVERGHAPNTDRVPDASRITPKSLPATRSGHDISLEVTLDAGLIVDAVTSKSHRVDIDRPDVRSARVRLKEGSTLPNKDFVLRYDAAGQAIQDALLTHRSEKGGYFTMILQPPDRIKAEDVMPKELVFVLDTSGSMQGFPLAKAKETMNLALGSLYPSDTFNLITFAGDTHVLFPEPVAATRANLRKAQAFLSSRAGEGGTEMMSAIKAALKPSDDQGHVRIVCFMTDGYVGNDMEIVAEIKKHQNARVFAFGIGQSVNRFLLDKMAEAGRGEVEYVSLSDDGSAAARRFHERVRNPLLTDISIDWNGLPVADVYPQRIPDLFGAKPVVLTGRYTSPGNATIRLKGKVAGNDFVREIPVSFPETMASHDVLAPLWARARIDDLMGQDYAGAQSGNMKPELRDTITQLGIEYRLMTQFTSFVAVEEMIVTDGGQPRRIDVPVETPAGMNVRVDQEESVNASRSFLAGAGAVARARVGAGAGAGVGSGQTGNFGYIVNNSPKRTPAPPPNSPPGVSVSATTQSLYKVATEPEAKDALASIRQKLQPSVLRVIERVAKKEALTSADEGGFVRNGKAEVKVWLTDNSPEVLAKLKELGFEVVLEVKTSKLIIGRVSIDKLQTLAEQNFVKYISPQVTK